MIYIYSKVGAGLLNVESDEPLNGLTVQDCSGTEVNAPVIRKQFEDGKHLYTLDASRLQCWSPNHPRLYVLQAGEVRQRFGYCELNTLDNRAVLLNGVPLYLRGCIRGIVAHDHPNMTGGTLRDAAVKYIRQAKKYGFNLVRFHSNVPSPEFVEAADEEGILIHLETGFSYEFDRVGTMKKLSMDNARWTETLLAYRNNPSLAIFCIGNEMHNSGHQPEVHKLYAEGRKLAPSKLMVDNSG
ncbi:MAG: hypothetical protein J6S21_04785 [Victivallales bacterium]|nr:hypothetical protein [Victivallales bacterium]